MSTRDHQSVSAFVEVDQAQRIEVVTLTMFILTHRNLNDATGAEIQPSPIKFDDIVKLLIPIASEILMTKSRLETVSSIHRDFLDDLSRDYRYEFSSYESSRTPNTFFSVKQKEFR